MMTPGRGSGLAPFVSASSLALWFGVAVYAVPQVIGPPPAADAGRIAGHLVDATTRAALPNAAVELSALREVLTAEGLPVFAPLNATEADRRGVSRPQTTRTDAGGAFVFNALRPGLYQLVARAPSYLIAVYGRQTHDGSSVPITLAAGQALEGISILAWKRPVVAGTVRDETGEPVSTVRVVALRRDYQGGRPYYRRIADAETDDRGEYRLTNLTPGSYIFAAPSTAVTISAEPDEAPGAGGIVRRPVESTTSGAPIPTGEEVSFGAHALRWVGVPGETAAGDSAPVVRAPGTTFHPFSLMLATATPIVLSAGRAETGIDISVQLQATVSVSGQLIGLPAEARRIGVRLLSESIAKSFLSTQGLETAWTVADDDGRFSFLGVPTGVYRVVAKVGTNAWQPEGDLARLLSLTPLGSGGFRPPAQPVGEPLYFADSLVAVGTTDVRNLVIPTREGMTISGTFELQGKATRPTDAHLRGVAVSLRPLDWAANPVTPAFYRSGSFTTASHPPGRYEIAVRHPNADWHLDAILIDGEDYYAKAIELTDRSLTNVVVRFSTEAASLVGSLSTDRSQPVEQATVVLLPADLEPWIAGGMLQRLVRRTPVAPTGTYEMKNVKPGRYLAVALRSDELGDLNDPEYVRSLSRAAVMVEVRSGLQTAAPLRLSSSRR